MGKRQKGKEYLQETESIDIQAEIESYADECDIKNIVRKASFDPQFMQSLSQGALDGTEVDITEWPQNIHEYHKMIATAQANAIALQEMQKETPKETPKEGEMKMNRNNERHFNQIPQMKASRTRFNRDQTILTTFDAGKLIPFYVDEVLPGDTFSVDTAAIIRMTTPKYPVMDDSFIDFYYFYCPNRILWDSFKHFMGEVEETPWMPTKTYTVPQIKINGTNEKPAPDERSILDYMGVPTKVKKPFSINALPIRAYVKIWNEFFRDENVDNAAVLKSDDADVTYTMSSDEADTMEKELQEAVTGGNPLPVNKFHDYFTSCLPYPQRGPEVNIPFEGNAPIYYGGKEKIYTKRTSRIGAYLWKMGRRKSLNDAERMV